MVLDASFSCADFVLCFICHEQNIFDLLDSRNNVECLVLLHIWPEHSWICVIKYFAGDCRSSWNTQNHCCWCSVLFPEDNN